MRSLTKPGTKKKVEEQRTPSKKTNKIVRNELTEEQKKEIKDAFKYFEKEGGIEPTQLKIAIEALGFDPRNEDINRILKDLSKCKKDKLIDYDNFLELMVEKPSDDPQVEMERAYKLLCGDGNDTITFKSLRKICDDLREKITDEEINEMIKEASKDSSNTEEVNMKDFCSIMKKTNMFN